MIELWKRAVLSGLDLNLEAQTLGLFRTSTKGSNASRRAHLKNVETLLIAHLLLWKH